MDPAETFFMDYTKKQTQSKIPDPVLSSLLPYMKLMTDEQKSTFKMETLNLMGGILEDTGLDQQSSTSLSESSTVYHTTFLQEAQDNSQLLLTRWKTE